MLIDSHQHFWRYSGAGYPWISEAMGRLRRDFLPLDLEPLLREQGLSGSIAVQARQSWEENEFLLGLADAHDLVKGVVGWVDLRGERADDELAAFASHPKAVGVRHVAQDEPDDGFLARPEFVRGVQKLAQHGLVYDILIYARQLPAAIELVRQCPDQPFVLDHIAKPDIRGRELAVWSANLRELARCPNVTCKVSGMVTEATWSGWQRDDFRPYLDVVLEAFGVDRLMYGSDWPVCLVAGDYDEVIGLVRGFFAEASPSAREAIFGGNACRVYGVTR